jgi:hypothetical protein
MKAAVSYVVSLSLAIACVPGLAQVQSPQPTPSPQPSEALPPGPNPNSQYRLGPDSLPQEGVPKGEVRGPYTLPSKVYPGTQHNLLGLRAGTIRSFGANSSDGLSGWTGFQRRAGRHSGSERDG